MIDLPWGKYQPYDYACSLLLSNLSDVLPLPHFFMLEENNAKVAIAVVEHTKMTIEIWQELSPPERVPWVEAANDAVVAKLLESKATPPKGGKPSKPATVAERMADDYLKDPAALASMPAEKLAQKYGCSKTAVMDTKTWKSIMTFRSFDKENRMIRDSRRRESKQDRER